MINLSLALRAALAFVAIALFTMSFGAGNAHAQHGCTQYTIEIQPGVDPQFFPLFLSVSFTGGSPVSVPHTFNGPTTQTFNNPPGKTFDFVDILGHIIRDDQVSHVIHLFPGGPCIAVTVLAGGCPVRIIIQPVSC